MSAAPVSRYTLGDYFGLYPIGLRKAVLRVSKGYVTCKKFHMLIRNFTDSLHCTACTKSNFLFHSVLISIVLYKFAHVYLFVHAYSSLHTHTQACTMHMQTQVSYLFISLILRIVMTLQRK